MKKIVCLMSIIAGIFLLYACTENEFKSSYDLPGEQEQAPWCEIVQTIDPASDLILVENTGSIQEAIDIATSGTTIFIEPGTYRESLIIEKENLRIVGIGTKAEECVILENPGSACKAFHLSVNPECICVENISLKDFDQSGLEKKSFETQSKKVSESWFSIRRTDLGGSIAHYEFELTLGTGPYDMVRVHRVVKEAMPFRPSRTMGDVFMVHGGIQDFEDIFLKYGAEIINKETSAPYYLASNFIDVWGIDLAWNMVPAETVDFSFMEDWGVEKDMQHTRYAMSIARLIRGLTGQGFHKMNLLGFSNGVITSYSAACLETQLHPIYRNLKGLIPVDSHFKTRPGSELDSINCSQANSLKEAMEAGIFHNADALTFQYFGNLALSAPNDSSAAFPGLTNLQALRAIVSMHSGGYHFHGGTAFELYYTDIMRLARVAIQLGPYMPNQLFYESCACPCSSEDVSFDDNLGDIRLPILFITAEGEEPIEDYTNTFVQSNDVTRINVEDPDKALEYDIGHGDIWAAYHASEWFWEPIRLWLLAHR